MEQQKIFFSYARADGAEFALKLAEDLRNVGANVWIDQLDILPSQRWDLEVQNALLTCDCLLFIVSKASVKSENVLDKVNYALNSQKMIIPVIINQCEKYFRISRFQHIDFIKDYGTGLQTLLKLLKLDKIKKIEPTPTILEPAPAVTSSNSAIQSDTEIKTDRRRVAQVLVSFEDVKPFTEGLAAIRKEFKWGYMDQYGTIVIQPKYSKTYGYKEGLAAVVLGKSSLLEMVTFNLSLYYSGRLGYIDSIGAVKIPIEHKYNLRSDEYYSFQEGLVSVLQNGKYGFIDKKGSMSIPFEYEEANNFNEGLAAVKKDEDGKWGFINKTGNVVIPFEYEDVRHFSEGLAAVKREGKWGFIDKAEKVIVPFKYEQIGFHFVDANSDCIDDCFHEGVIGLIKNGKCGFIDKESNVVIPFEYGSVKRFNEGLAIVANGKTNKYGYIDREGNVLIPFEYGSVKRFNEGLAIVANGKTNKYGYIDREGNVLIPFEYDSAEEFKDGLAIVIRNGKCGVIDKNGNEIVPLEYSSVTNLGYGLIKAEASVTKIVFDNHGNTLATKS